MATLSARRLHYVGLFFLLCDKPTLSHSEPTTGDREQAIRRPGDGEGREGPLRAVVHGLKGLILLILALIAQQSHSRLCCAIRRKSFGMSGGPVATRTPDLYRVKVAL